MPPKALKDDDPPHADNGEIESFKSTAMRVVAHALLALMVFGVYHVLFAHAVTSIPGNSPVCGTKDLNVLSCSPESVHTDTCCVESPGGLLSLAQLYNWNPGLGPEDSWTIHGLWPDFCNGSYPSSCDPSRTYTDVPKILKKYKQGSILEYMREYWRNDPPVTTENGTDADLWAHEWSKHGSCMSTLRPSCYPHYNRHLELIDFYASTIRVYQSYPTDLFLSICGIVPTNSTTYTLADIEDCLASATGGFLPHVGCSKAGYLNEVWYYLHLRGRISDGIFEGTNSTFKSTCPVDGIKYPPKLSLGRD